jgi:hypothetical protein
MQRTTLYVAYNLSVSSVLTTDSFSVKFLEYLDILRQKYAKIKKKW